VNHRCVILSFSIQNKGYYIINTGRLIERNKCILYETVRCFPDLSKREIQNPFHNILCLLTLILKIVDENFRIEPNINDSSII